MAPTRPLDTTRIEPLADHLSLVGVVARWHHEEWGSLRADRTLQDWVDGIASRALGDEIPTTFVAFDGGTPIGTAMLVEHDLDSRRDLTPWLAGVYVRPEYRNGGVGAALVTHATRRAAELGVETLYLHTQSSGAARELYARLGWDVIASLEHERTEVVVMAIALVP